MFAGVEKKMHVSRGEEGSRVVGGGVERRGIGMQGVPVNPKEIAKGKLD